MKNIRQTVKIIGFGHTQTKISTNKDDKERVQQNKRTNNRNWRTTSSGNFYIKSTRDSGSYLYSSRSLWKIKRRQSSELLKEFDSSVDRGGPSCLTRSMFSPDQSSVFKSFCLKNKQTKRIEKKRNKSWFCRKRFEGTPSPSLVQTKTKWKQDSHIRKHPPGSN